MYESLLCHDIFLIIVNVIKHKTESTVSFCMCCQTIQCMMMLSDMSDTYRYLRQILEMVNVNNLNAIELCTKNPGTSSFVKMKDHASSKGNII